MNNFNEDYFFGPLPKSYCLYFYYLSVIGLVLLVLSVLSSIAMMVSRTRSPEFFMNTFMISLSYVIFYFQNRLLYTMCIN